MRRNFNEQWYSSIFINFGNMTEVVLYAILLRRLNNLD